MILNQGATTPTKVFSHIWVESNNVFPDWDRIIARHGENDICRYRIFVKPHEDNMALLFSLEESGKIYIAKYENDLAIMLATAYFVSTPSSIYWYNGLPAPTREMLWTLYNGKCAYCGTETVLRWHGLPPKNLSTIDHVIPTVDGGDTVWENVINACRKCNSAKGSRSIEDFVGAQRAKEIIKRHRELISAENLIRLAESKIGIRYAVKREEMEKFVPITSRGAALHYCYNE